MDTINREELAWAAGFIDGEGCFGFYTYTQKGRSTLYGMIKLEVVQVDRRALDRIQKAIRVGNVTGPYDRKNPKWTPIHHLQVYGIEDITIAAHLLDPWLGPVKRDQAATAIAQYHQWEKVPNRPKRRGGHRTAKLQEPVHAG